MAFKDELRKLRKQDGLTQKELAKKLGLSNSTISMYERGNREPDFEILEAIADFFNVDMNKLTGRSFCRIPTNIAALSFNSVPLVGRIACGTPVLAEQNIEEYVDMPKHVKADFALMCKGESMIGAGIYDGDVVYIRQQPVVNDGQIAAVLIDDEATLKRVYQKNGALILQPENATYAPLIYTGEELRSIRIIGLAVAFTHSLI